MATFIKAGFWEKLCKQCNGYKGWLNLDQFVQDKINSNPRGLPYKVYTALLSQTGTNDPVAIILENTLGETPIWNRDGVGHYKMVTVGDVFKVNKTVSFIGHNYDTPLAIWQFGRADSNGPLTEKTIWLQVFNNLTNLPIDISSGGSGYYDTYVEVRVYN